jgi:hypothetical protein
VIIGQDVAVQLGKKIQSEQTESIGAIYNTSVAKIAEI